MLVGHDHDYERFATADAARPPLEIWDPGVVVGTGGESLYGFDAVARNSVRRYDESFGVLHVSLGRARYSGASCRRGKLGGRREEPLHAAIITLSFRQAQSAPAVPADLLHGTDTWCWLSIQTLATRLRRSSLGCSGGSPRPKGVT